MPHPTAIGNASEDYLFGLLYARKNKKKLVTIISHPILRKTGFYCILSIMTFYKIFVFCTPVTSFKIAIKKKTVFKFTFSKY